MKLFLSFFEPSLYLCSISCFFLLASSDLRASWYYFSWFSFINFLFGSLKNCLFVFGKITKISLILLLLKKTLCFCSFLKSFSCKFVFRARSSKNISLFFFVVNPFFEKILFFCLDPFVSVQKMSPQFSSFSFLLFLSSFSKLLFFL